MFQPVSRSSKIVTDTSKVTEWNLKVLINEIIKSPSTSDNSLNPGINYFNSSRIWMNFDGNCLKYEKITFTHKQIGNIYIVYQINLWPFSVSQDFVLGSYLFGAVKLIKNSDCYGTWTHNYLHRKWAFNHLPKLPKWLGSVVRSVRSIWLCYYHITYLFLIESTLYSCLNINALLSRNRRDI